MAFIPLAPSFLLHKQSETGHREAEVFAVHLNNKNDDVATHAVCNAPRRTTNSIDEVRRKEVYVVVTFVNTDS